MSTATLQLDDTLQRYLHESSLREPGPCQRLRTLAATRDDANLISSPEQTQLLALVAGLMGARRVLEVGTYVGYTPLWLALTLDEAARFVCIEHDDEIAAIAANAWREAGVDERVERIAEEAEDALVWLLREGQAGLFDLVYIDADKERQVDYYELCLRLVRKGGLIAVDNTLWSGRVADPADTEEATQGVRRFNRHVHTDERVDISLVPIGDGLTLLRKRHTGEP